MKKTEILLVDQRMEVAAKHKNDFERVNQRLVIRIITLIKIIRILLINLSHHQR